MAGPGIIFPFQSNCCLYFVITISSFLFFVFPCEYMSYTLKSHFFCLPLGLEDLFLLVLKTLNTEYPVFRL